MALPAARIAGAAWWQRGRRFLMLGLLLAGVAWISLTRVQDPTLLGPPGQRPPNPQRGFPAPDFTLSTVDGQDLQLGALRGKVVVLNFWATWCPPCQAEMAHLQAVADAHAGRNVAILGVNQAETQAQVAGFLAARGLTFPVVLDGNAAVSQRYRVRSLPTTFFIGADGVIREIVIGGPLSQVLIESKVQALLAATP